MQKMELYSSHYWPTLRGIVVLVISKSAGEKEKMLFDLAKVEQNNFKFSTHAKKIKIKIITMLFSTILRVCITRKFNTNGQIFAFFIIVGTTALFIPCILSCKLLKPIKTRGSCYPLIWWIFFVCCFSVIFLGSTIDVLMPLVINWLLIDSQKLSAFLVCFNSGLSLSLLPKRVWW